MKRPVLVSLLAALAVALLAAGCGSSGGGEDENQQATPIGSQEVIQQFDDVPGMPPLETAAGSDPSWEQLSLGLDLSPAQQQRFGTFTIYVVDPEDPEAVTSLLADKDTAEPLEADAQGIYWDYDELAKSYVAQKRYGPNVVLAWWNEQRKEGTDERWQRLDELLRGIANG
jgi:nitrous oxide reductase accessory protein NosL